MHNLIRETGLKNYSIDDFKPDEMDYFTEPEEEKKIQTIFFRDDSKSIIAKNDSYDVGFEYSINPYRGCEHGCVYCYARPSHEFLGFSAGTDFESKIMIKKDAPKLLEAEFNKKSYKPDFLMFSGNTDCYQPVERHAGDYQGNSEGLPEISQSGFYYYQERFSRKRYRYTQRNGRTGTCFCLFIGYYSR